MGSGNSKNLQEEHMTDKLNGARDVIVACDFASAEETMAFLGKFGDERPFVKIGL